MDVDDVVGALEFLSEQDLRRVNDVTVAHMRRWMGEKQRKAAALFSVGDKVSFKAKRSGAWVLGTITKINMKTVHLRTNTGETWHVSPSILVKEIV